MSGIAQVTSELNALLIKDSSIQRAMAFLATIRLFTRETRSAALGEISEHLVAELAGGRREDRGNRGFDVIGGAQQKIEVKSRLLSRYGDGLKFDFRQHTKDAAEAYCIAWDDRQTEPTIYEAYKIPVGFLKHHWGLEHPHRYCARTTLGKLRKAWKEAQLDEPRSPAYLEAVQG